MRDAQEHAGPERQLVHRRFTIRWIPGCVHTSLQGGLEDDADTRAEIGAWAAALREVLAELGPEYLSILDVSALGPIPRSLWLELVELTRGMLWPPRRRAVITAEGSVGDSQAAVAQLVTAGNARAFRPDQLDAAIVWLGEAGIHDAATLARFVR